MSSFTIHLPVVIRRCTRADLPHLEWFGQFTMHREIIEHTFAAQQRGEQIMLVADVNGAPAGQIWLDLMRRKPQGAGYLWALRVFPWLHRLGIGTRLLAAAEHLLQKHGFTQVELGVETHNQRATRLYERLGYQRTGALHEEYCYTAPDGRHMRIGIEEWIYRKHLAQAQDQHL